MSFALEVKEEIVSHTFSDAQEQAFLCGFIKYNAELIYSDSLLKLHISTISNKIARTLLTFMRKHYQGEVLISITQPQTLKKQKVYHLTLNGEVKNFLMQLNIIDAKQSKVVKVSQEILDHSDLLRSYVAGMFVAIGSVNAPQSYYHLELRFREDADALYFQSLMHDQDFDFKLLNRKNQIYLTYLKKATLISDFLKFIDAGLSVMKFENERISRDMVNSINRISNIDISNQAKVLKTAAEQVKQITYIKQHHQMQKLSEKANVLANLRLRFPESSYVELESEMQKKGFVITKSGIANLFKNIAKLYDEIYKDD